MTTGINENVRRSKGSRFVAEIVGADRVHPSALSEQVCDRGPESLVPLRAHSSGSVSARQTLPQTCVPFTHLPNIILSPLHPHPFWYILYKIGLVCRFDHYILCFTANLADLHRLHQEGSHTPWDTPHCIENGAPPPLMRCEVRTISLPP